MKLALAAALLLSAALAGCQSTQSTGGAPQGASAGSDGSDTIVFTQDVTARDANGTKMIFETGSTFAAEHRGTGTVYCGRVLVDKVRLPQCVSLEGDTGLVVLAESGVPQKQTVPAGAIQHTHS